MSKQDYFIANNVANITVKPDYSSALDSQAIAGIKVVVEKTKAGYCFVKTPDLYEGWVSKLRLVEAWEASNHKKICVKTLFADVYSAPDLKADIVSRLVISTCLSIGGDCANELFVEIILPDKQRGFLKKNCIEFWDQSSMNENILAKKWQSSSKDERTKLIMQLGENISNSAKQLLATPYLWGGCTPFGIDCSGLSQLVYKVNGIQLLRNSYMQYDDKRFSKIEMGKALDKAKFMPGDILFFDTDNRNPKKLNHTGIACGDGTFIEASGQSRYGQVMLNPCSDSFFRQCYIGAVRLHVDCDIAQVLAYNQH